MFRLVQFVALLALTVGLHHNGASTRQAHNAVNPFEAILGALRGGVIESKQRVITSRGSTGDQFLKASNVSLNTSGDLGGAPTASPFTNSSSQVQIPSGLQENFSSTQTDVAVAQDTWISEDAVREEAQKAAFVRAALASRSATAPNETDHDFTEGTRAETERSNATEQVVAHQVSALSKFRTHVDLSEPCSIGSECKSMCRWLKMSKKEDNGKCQLFEWQLKSCDYVAPDARLKDAAPAPLDCVVNFLRTPVLLPQVNDYVTAIEDCVDHLPQGVNATCHVALGLLRDEIADWKSETRLQSDAADLSQQLKNASSQGRAALDSKAHEEEAIDALSDALEKAEMLPGHFLVRDIREARGLLDKLEPIPAVRQELLDAMANSRYAFDTTSLFRTKEAIVWLGVSTKKAHRLGLEEEVAEANKALAHLTSLKAALLDLKTATSEGNASVTTKSGIHDTLVSLNASVHRARDAGLTGKMDEASGLLVKLAQLEGAVERTQRANGAGKAVAAEGGNKGEKSLERVIPQLSTAVRNAKALGLGDNDTVAEAVDTLDRLRYIRHARLNLHEAVDEGRATILANGSALSDDAEEIAVSVIEPAIKWGEDVGLKNGVDAARAMESELKSREKAKEGMAVALAQGNASLSAKAGAEGAIQELQASVAEAMKANVSAGVQEAQRQIKLLKALAGARQALLVASSAANSSVDRRSGYVQAIAGLNESMGRAGRVGLGAESDVAAEKLEMLEVFAVAERHLAEALNHSFTDYGALGPVSVEDDVPANPFKKRGYKVTHSPPVPGAEDDGDDDFQEHIDALEREIEASKSHAQIDPEMEAQLERARARKSVFAMLGQATRSGTAALAAKDGIEASLMALAAATEEATEMHVIPGFKEASELLKKLVVIPPARQELRAAMLQANVSIHTVSGMDVAIMRLNRAIESNKGLDLLTEIPKAESMSGALSNVKKIYVGVRAAILQGQIALQNEQGEEAAIAELNRALKFADDINLKKRVPDAIDLLHELMHMNAQHQKMQESMTPN